jgi:hypothetical protein
LRSNAAVSSVSTWLWVSIVFISPSGKTPLEAEQEGLSAAGGALTQAPVAGRSFGYKQDSISRSSDPP